MLFTHFRQFGSIRTIWLSQQRGRCLGFGTIIIDDRGTLKRILNQPHHVILGRKVILESYLSGRRLASKRSKTGNRRVYIKNIDYDLSDGQLRASFSAFGSIENAYRILAVGGAK